MGAYYLSERIGDVVTMVAPAAHATDLVTSDHTGVSIKDCAGILFILTAGVMTGDSVTVSLAYSSTGANSDASASTTVWAASDCVFAAVDSDSENSSFYLDMDLRNKPNLTDRGGKIYAASQSVGDGIWSLVAIPYHLNYSPATNATTVVKV